MIWINNLDSADQIVRYYSKRHTLESYYSENQEFNGYWGGKAAKLLGLEGYITDEALGRLAHNLDPKTGKQLTERMRADRRPGFDITFDVPKSVSLAYAYSKDERIIRLVRQIVHDTMEEIEREAATRVRTGLDKNADGDRPTGNLCSAEFVHLTARPENGYSDPHLHVHVVVFNLTFDPVEMKWKALQMGDIHKEVQYYQGAFHRRLKEGLEAMGLATVPSGKFFEVEGIPGDLNDLFSRRTKKIEETAARLGITDPAQKAKLGAMTRDKKDKALLLTDLEPFWWGGLSPEYREALEGVKTRLRQSLAQELIGQMAGPSGLERSADALGTLDQPPTPKEFGPSSDSLGERKQLKAGNDGPRQSQNKRTRPGAAAETQHAATEHDRRAVAMAIEHLLERKSAVTEKKLLGEAFNCWSIGRATRTGIIQAVAEAPLLRREVNGKIWVTTPEVLMEEERIIDLCRRGHGKFEPLNPTWKISDERLNEGQRQAALHALHSRDFITGISGIAGGGKTTVMREIKRGIEAGFGKALVLAPLAATARDTLPKDGFKNAATIAHFLKSEALQKEAIGGVLLVDEAGLIPTRLAKKLLSVAESLGTQVILVGDTGQLHAVERGQAFDLLRRKADMRVANVTEILRQNGPYKEFVELFVSGETKRAVTSLWSMGSMVQQPLDELAKTLANDYVGVVEKGKTAVVVSPTHAEGDKLTDAIREKLKERGLLGKAERHETLRPLAWPDDHKSNPERYHKGLVVQFNQRVNGFAPGQRVEVLDVREDAVRVRCHSGSQPGIKPLPLNQAEKFDVYGRQNIEAVQWETLRNLGLTETEKSDPAHYRIGQVIQINDHVKGFALGEQMEVVGISDDLVRVRGQSNGHSSRTKPLPLSRPDKFSVYERKTIEICEKESIRLTGNGHTADRRRLNNGSKYQVDYIAPDGRLVLNNGLRIGKEFSHVAHGYVLTPYAAQGMTADWVFACQTQELSAGATNREQFHVATTRGREGLTNYTDNFEWLKESVSQDPERMMASELLSAIPTERAPAQDERLYALEAQEFALLPEIDEANAPAYEPVKVAEVIEWDGHKEASSERLGKGNSEKLAAELERIASEKEELELERDDDLEMEL